MHEFIVRHIEPVAELWDQDTPSDQFVRAIIASTRIFFENVGQIPDDENSRVNPLVNQIVLDFNQNLGSTMRLLEILGKIRNAGSF
jgi:hypothetical protein